MATLLVGLAHPDDELGMAGAISAQRARGDRVIVVWLTRGEMTEAYGPIPQKEVARRREALGAGAGEILDVETRFLDFADTRLQATPDAARRVAEVLCEIQPDGLLTWGDAWVRGQRHPDHQACGRIFRDAITLARIAKVVAPRSPHRADVPVFTIRGAHSSLPRVAVDVSPHVPTIRRLADYYVDELGFGDPEWLENRLRRAGREAGLEYAEFYDAWESEPGIVESLLSADQADLNRHPDRDRRLRGAVDGRGSGSAPDSG